MVYFSYFEISKRLLVCVERCTIFSGALCAPAAGAESKRSARRYRVVDERVFVLGSETGTATTTGPSEGPRTCRASDFGQQPRQHTVNE